MTLCTYFAPRAFVRIVALFRKEQGVTLIRKGDYDSIQLNYLRFNIPILYIGSTLDRGKYERQRVILAISRVHRRRNTISHSLHDLSSIQNFDDFQKQG